MSFTSYLAALAVVFIWAYNGIMIKVGVQEIPPMLLTMLRFVVVAALIVPFTRFPRGHFKTLMLLAFTFGFVHFGLLFLAMNYTEVGITMVLIQLGTPFTILLAVYFLNEHLTSKKIIGIIISFIGVICLMGSPNLPPLFAIMTLIISAFGWAITNIIIKQRAADIEPLTLTGWLSLFAIPIVGLASLVTEHNQVAAIAQASWAGWSSVLYSAIISSIIGYGIWYSLLKRYPINIVLPISLLSPVLGVILGTLLMHEALNSFKIIGTLLVIGGILFANIQRKRIILPPAK